MRNDLQAAVEHLEAMAQNAIESAADADMPEQQKTALWAEYKALDTALTALRSHVPDPDTGLMPCGCGGGSMSDITVTSETYGTLCICAVRYALGRQTYMPDEVATAVLQALDKLPDNDLTVLLRDIKAYLLKPNGDVNDKVWYKLGNRLFDEMDRRNEQRQRVAPDDHQDYTDTNDEWARRAGVRNFRIPNETKRPESLLSEVAHTVKESRDTLEEGWRGEQDGSNRDCGNNKKHNAR